MKNKKISRKSKKKSQSGIITTILIILLCLVAILILWNLLIPILKNTQEQTGIKQEAIATHISVNKVSGDLSGPILNLTLTRGSGEMRFLNQTIVPHEIQVPVTEQVDADIISVVDLTTSMHNGEYLLNDSCTINYSSPCCLTHNNCLTASGCSACNGKFNGTSCLIDNATYLPQYCINNNCSNISICSADKIAGFFEGLHSYCAIEPACLTGINCTNPDVCQSIGGQSGNYNLYNKDWTYCEKKWYIINSTISCHSDVDDNPSTYGESCRDICRGSSYTYNKTIIIPGKIDYANNATEDFINNVFLKGNNSLGLVGFKEKVYPVDISQVSYADGKNYLMNFVNLWNANGSSTCIACGLQTAKSMLLSPANGRYKAIILMSDGASNILLDGTHDDPLYNYSQRESIDMATSASQNNITVYTIGFGNDSNNISLKKIADAGGGTFSFSNISGLSVVYNQILNTIQSKTVNSTETYYEPVQNWQSLRIVVHNATSSYVYNIPKDTPILLPLETRTYQIETGNLTNINKIEVYIVIHLGTGKEDSELISTWKSTG